MKGQLIASWKLLIANAADIIDFKFPKLSFTPPTLCVAALALLLPACGSSFNDEEPLVGSRATDIDEVANQPVPDAKFSMGSDEYRLIGSLPTVEVVQQARSEIYIHE